MCELSFFVLFRSLHCFIVEMVLRYRLTLNILCPFLLFVAFTRPSALSGKVFYSVSNSCCLRIFDDIVCWVAKIGVKFWIDGSTSDISLFLLLMLLLQSKSVIGSVHECFRSEVFEIFAYELNELLNNLNKCKVTPSDISDYYILCYIFTFYLGDRSFY